MACKTFDAVIVGGGNKALVTAMYLTKYGGLKVGIFEERHELGGGWSSEEPAPGFIANTCSTQHYDFYYLPLREDFPEWEDYGARVAYSKCASGAVYIEDDTSVLMYNRKDDPDQEKTAREFARFSQKDANTWLWLWDKLKRYWEPAINEWIYTPAQPPQVLDAMDRLFRNPDAGVDPLWLCLPPLGVYKDLFEEPHIQHAFARNIQSWGFQQDQNGMGWAALMCLLYIWPQACYVIGGTHQLTHASQRVILENGGEVFTKYGVEKIIIENGRAKGIRLQDGTEVEAKKVVISTVDPYQLCFQLMGREHLSPKILRRVENLERHWIAITWYTWALKERPKYKAESFNPDVWNCEWLALTDLDLDTFKVESSERKAGKWPSKTNLIVSYHTCREDTLLAPKERAVALTEQYVLPADSMTEKEWKEWERRHAEDVISVWQGYAPNMTWDNVIGYNPVTPFYTAHQCKNYAPAGNWCVIDDTLAQSGRFRPIPELAGHRIPIKGLYATGTAWHPMGYAGTSHGYTCYKVIAEDLGLRKPWLEKGRPY